MHLDFEPNDAVYWMGSESHYKYEGDEEDRKIEREREGERELWIRHTQEL